MPLFRDFCLDEIRAPGNGDKRHESGGEELGVTPQPDGPSSSSHSRPKEWLKRPKKPLRLLAFVSTELMESFLPDAGMAEVQLPAPPRPTW